MTIDRILEDAAVNFVATVIAQPLTPDDFEGIEKVATVLKKHAPRATSDDIQFHAGVLWHCARSDYDGLRDRNLGKTVAQKRLAKVMHLVGELKCAIEEMPADARHALRVVSSESELDRTATAAGLLGVPPIDLLLVRAFPSEQELSDTELPRLAANLANAIQYLEENPTTAAGQTRGKALFIAGQAAHIFTLLTSKKAGRVSRRKSDFVRFLEALFDENCLSIDANADNMVKALAKRRKEMKVVFASFK